MNIYSYSDLRDLITDLVKFRQAKGEKITFERLAQAARVQKAHISNVLKGRASFQPDQVYLICQELNLSSEERHYSLLLLEHERSGLQERKNELFKEIENFQQKHLQTEQHIQALAKNANYEKSFPDYYLDPLHQIIHIAISVDRFSRDPEALAEGLGFPKVKVLAALDNLKKHGFIIEKQGRFVNLHKKIHLKSSSPLYPAWRFQLQNLALARARMLPTKNTYGFSAAFSADLSTFRKIQSKILEMLKEVESDVSVAPPDQVYHFSIDLFPWSE